MPRTRMPVVTLLEAAGFDLVRQRDAWVVLDRTDIRADEAPAEQARNVDPVAAAAAALARLRTQRDALRRHLASTLSDDDEADTPDT